MGVRFVHCVTILPQLQSALGTFSTCIPIKNFEKVFFFFFLACVRKFYVCHQPTAIDFLEDLGTGVIPFIILDKVKVKHSE